MHSYAEALSLFKTIDPIWVKEKLPLHKALKRLLWEDIAAPLPSPSFTNSQMDGFAFRHEQIDFNSPVHVVEDIYAGRTIPSLPVLRNPQECVRIMTGAPLPANANTVVPVENVVKINPNTIQITQSVAPGAYVRRVGEDIQVGETLFRAGTMLSAEKLAMLANFGIENVWVRLSPLVILLTTGDELLTPGERWEEGKIFDSNGPFLAAAIETMKLDVHAKQHISDDLNENILRVGELLAGLPKDRPILLISSGAVSAGDKDFIPALTKHLGFDPLLHKVAVRPGKPVFLARREEILWFGIPGNPISTVASWYYFLRPLLEHWAGIPALKPITVRLARNIKKPKDLRCFYRASIEDNLAFVFEQQGSSHFRASILANGLVDLAEGYDTLPEGTQVKALITQ